MPCNSDYMNPNYQEANSKEVATLLIFVNNKLTNRGKAITIKNYGGWSLTRISEYFYGKADQLDNLTADLCSTLSGLTPQEQREIIYNGFDKTSRRLADWWDEHQEADRKRLAEEAAEQNRQATIRSAKSKLSRKEKEALGLL